MNWSSALKDGLSALNSKNPLGKIYEMKVYFRIISSAYLCSEE